MVTQSRFKQTTLRELGRSLPVGFEVAGKLVKTLDLVPYKLAQERELARARREGLNGITYTARALSHLVRAFGPHNLGSMEKVAERELVLSQAYMGDILYAYLYMRREAIGPELPINIICPRCKTDGEPTATPITADLDTLEILVCENPEDLRYKLSLRDGMKLNGKMVTALNMEPALWGRLDPQAGVGDDALATLNMLRASIVSAEGLEGPPVLLDQDADEISRFDISVIERTIGENAPGPVMMVEGRCAKCKTKLVQTIPWLDSSFFLLPSSEVKPKTT